MNSIRERNLTTADPQSPGMSSKGHLGNRSPFWIFALFYTLNFPEYNIAVTLLSHSCGTLTKCSSSPQDGGPQVTSTEMRGGHGNRAGPWGKQKHGACLQPSLCYCAFSRAVQVEGREQSAVHRSLSPGRGSNHMQDSAGHHSASRQELKSNTLPTASWYQSHQGKHNSVKPWIDNTLLKWRREQVPEREAVHSSTDRVSRPLHCGHHFLLMSA